MRRLAFPVRFHLALALAVLLAVFAAGTGAATAQVPGLPTAPNPASASAQSGSGQSGGQDAASTDTQLRKLLDVLKNDQARQRLITEIENSLAASGQSPQGAAKPADNGPAVAEDLRSIGARVADLTEKLGTSTRRSVQQLFGQLAQTPRIFANLTPDDISFMLWLLAHLITLVIVTYGGLFAMRALTERLRHRLKLTIRREGWIAKTLAAIATLLLDVVNLLVPWAVGYLAAFAILGNPGTISFAQSLYLNAFAALEVIMAVLRFVLTPRRDEARLVRLESEQALSVLRWCRAIGILLVYGQLLIMPLVARTMSSGAGRAIGIVGVTVVLLVVAAAVLRAHGFVTRLLMSWAGRRRGLAGLARYWHVPALAYLLGLFVLALTRPLATLYFVLLDNLQIVIAIIVGMVVNNLITAVIGRGIRLPRAISARTPLLQKRMNALVPQALQVLRVLVMIIVAAFCLNTLGVMDVIAFLDTRFGSEIVWGTASVAVIVLAAFGLWLVLSSWIEYRINPDYSVTSARERTLLTLLRNAFTITLVIIALMFVFSALGINIAPLLASAGVVGLAIGFGAQKAVQDIITGIFIQLEGAIDVGDVVSIGGISGVVERLTVRSAALRDLEGTYHIIPFSSVDTVTNYMRGFAYALIDMGVAYREDIEDAKQAMFDAFAELKTDPELSGSIIDELEWMGLDKFGASEIVLRARIRTLPGMQWTAKRHYNAILKKIFDERGIEIPFPHHTVYFGEDKAGNAPPVHVVNHPDQKTSGPSQRAPRQAEAPPAEEKPRQPVARDQTGSHLPDPDAGPGDGGGGGADGGR